MLELIEKFKSLIGTKTSWGSKELLDKIDKLKQSITDKARTDGNLQVVVTGGKKVTVEEIKKYDVVYLPLIGMPHYMLVHKVISETVYGVVFSSKDKESHFIHTIKEDRYFIGSYASNAYLAASLAECKDSFVRVFESRKEADVIFNKVKDYFKNTLKF